ncbi:MAG: hypothetical protein ACI9LM_004647 [Alteromonadaceae bacterium]
MKNIDVYIYAPDYDVNSGGSIALHRLCHLINQIDGFNGYLVPRKVEVIRFHSIRAILGSLKNAFFITLKGIRKLKVNKNWDTPVRKKLGYIKDKAIVVYPEVTFGNPLRAKNVVRWLLHQPGHFHQEFHFGVNELYFKFNSAICDFEYCYSKTSSNELKVIYYPMDLYNVDQIEKRDINSHIVRKGKDKQSIHNKESVAIDGMSHEEVASILKRSKRFISYDDYTAYSIFAVLCGCESIVVPGVGVKKEEWYPNESDRYGIGYGTDQVELDWAMHTREKVLEHVKIEHERSLKCVSEFLNESSEYFKL